MSRAKPSREVTVKIKMPKEMYDDFLETYENYKRLYKNTELKKQRELANSSFEKFVSRMIVEVVSKNLVFIIKDKK